MIFQSEVRCTSPENNFKVCVGSLTKDAVRGNFSAFANIDIWYAPG